MYKNMKPGYNELIGFKKICMRCTNEHLHGLYKTGYTVHAGIHNKVLNVGGYYSTNPRYLNSLPIYTHDKSCLYLLREPNIQLITTDIKNPKLINLVNLYGNYDLVRHIESTHEGYYGSISELQQYLKFCDRSYIYINNLSKILYEISNNSSVEHKNLVIKNNKEILDEIYIYKEYNFNEIVSIYDSIFKIINNL